MNDQIHAFSRHDVTLPGLRDVQGAGRTLFLYVSVRMFPEVTDIVFSRPSKADHHPQCGFLPIHPGHEENEKAGGGQVHSLC